MKTVLCYGDSNTWGYDPSTGARYDFSTRWPGVLQAALGDGYRVAEEGLCGRTTCFDDPLCEGRNGAEYLPVSLSTHMPTDILLIMLGTNDLKISYDLAAFTIAQGAARLLEMARAFEPKIPRVILISPPALVETDQVEYREGFAGGIEKSTQLPKHFQYFAEKNGCEFFDATSISAASPVDGVHLSAETHSLLGKALSERILSEKS